MPELNRRELLVVAGTAAACAACCGEELLAEEAAGPTTVDVGVVAEYSADGVKDAFAKSGRFFVIRRENKLFASSSVCTHKSCALKIKEDTITCPCHRSKFTNTGTVVNGPAKVPLPRYGISVNEQSRIIVDKTKKFDEARWTEAGAFIEMA
jgi:Rieske Fe-S protein